MKQRIVVCALISSGGKYLFIRQNKSGGAYPNSLHIPGGGLEPGEDLVAGLQREIMEETNITVKNIVPYDFDSDELEYEGERTHLIFLRFLADYRSGQPKPGSDASQVVWIEKSDLSKHHHNPPTMRLLSKLGLL